MQRFSSVGFLRGAGVAACAVTFSGVTMMGTALDAAAAAPPEPKLIVTVVVDQYSSDLFNEYRPLYRDGLKILSSGIVFPRGHQGHASTETCPGHSTILTGSRPSRTGIIANDWQAPQHPQSAKGAKSYDVYCAKDPATGAVSTRFLRTPTLGDRMRAVDSESKVVAVAGKDRAATMLAGHNATLTLWWTSKGFETYAGGDLPKGIADVNKHALLSMKSDVPVDTHFECAARANSVELVKDVDVGVPSNDTSYSAWRASPALDEVTLDAALAALDELQLGRGAHTDLLAVSFSATDYVGHRYGTGGIEMCTQQLHLDVLIGRLIDRLNRIDVPYVVVLTADHGGLDVTERNAQQGVGEARRIAATLYPKAMDDYLRRELRVDRQVVLGDFFTPDVYFSADLSAKVRARAIKKALDRYRQSPDVETVFTREELLAAAAPRGPVDEWTLLERAKASFDPERSGSLIVMVKPFVTGLPAPQPGQRDYVAGHGSPWGYDRRVPIVFWWPGIAGFEQPRAVETADIMPTLARMIGLDASAREIDGHALDLDKATH